MDNVPDRSKDTKRQVPSTLEELGNMVSPAHMQEAFDMTRCAGTDEPKCDPSVGVICDKHYADVTKSRTAFLKSKGLNRAGNIRKRR